MKSKKKLIIGIVVTVIALAAFIHVARQEDWGKTWAAFKEANYWLVIPSLALLYLSLLFRAYRWKVFLHGHGEYGIGELFAFTTVGFMGNSIFPARAGEFMRSILLANKKKKPFLTIFATIGVERLFDLAVIIAIFAVTLIWAPFPEGWAEKSPEAAKMVKASGVGALVFFAVILAGIFLLTFRPELFKSILRLTVGKVLGKNLSEKIIGLVDPFVGGLSCLRSVRLILLSIFWSLLVWASVGLSEYFIFLAFTPDIGITAAFLIMTIIAFAVAAPSTPGYLGIYDVVCQLVLIGVFQIENAIATSATLVLHASQLFPIILLGFVCLWWQGLSFKSLKETEKMAEEKKEEVHEE